MVFKKSLLVGCALVAFGGATVNNAYAYDDLKEPILGLNRKLYGQTVRSHSESSEFDLEMDSIFATIESIPADIEKNLETLDESQLRNFFVKKLGLASELSVLSNHLSHGYKSPYEAYLRPFYDTVQSDDRVRAIVLSIVKDETTDVPFLTRSIAFSILPDSERNTFQSLSMAPEFDNLEKSDNPIELYATQAKISIDEATERLLKGPQSILITPETYIRAAMLQSDPYERLRSLKYLFDGDHHFRFIILEKMEALTDVELPYFKDLIQDLRHNGKFLLNAELQRLIALHDKIYG